MNITTLKALRPLVCFTSALALSCSIFAQSAKPAPAATIDETVKLSAFEVAATSGYTSSMTSSGTRIQADIRELPISVGIVTSEFLNDFVAFNDYKDSFAYTSGVSTRGNYNQAYYVRGFQNDGQLRNGFFRAGMFDAVNVDRIEVIEGPNAAIYGRSNPGGTINVVTKKPTPYFNSYLTARIGDNDLRRYELGISGPIWGKHLRARLDMSKHNENTFYDHEILDQRVLSGVVDYVFDSGAKLSFEADWMDKVLHATNARTFFRKVGTLITSDLATELGSFSSISPQEYTRRSLRSFNLTFEQNFTPWMQFRSTAHMSARPTANLTNGGNAFYDVATRTITGRRTQYSPASDDYRAFQADLLFDFDLGPTHHKLLTSYDYTHDWGPSQTWQVASNLVSNNSFNVATINIDSPNYFMITDPTQLTNFSKDVYSTAALAGLFASDRVYFANKRGMFLLGGRENWIHTTKRDNVAKTYSDEKHEAFTYQLGLNWKLSEAVSVYTNYSTSYQVNGGLDSTGHSFANEKGKGGEVGSKAEFFDKRLSVTVAYFDITRYNVVVTNPVTTLQELTGEQNSHGAELNFHFQVTSAWQVFGQATSLRARIIHNASDRTLEGFQLNFVPDQSYGLATRYEFHRGALRGAFVTLGWKYVGQITTSISTNPYQRNYRQPSYTQLDGSLGYAWKAGDRFANKVSLNLKNLTDEKSFFGDRERNPGFGVVVSYTLSFK